MSALDIGICFRLNISVNASNEPMVSHFKISPVVSVSINTDFISDSSDFLNSSASALSDVAYTVLPGNTPSRSGDAIFIPAAA